MALRRAASGRGREGAGIYRRSAGFTYSATYGGAQLEGEPYTVAPGSDFSWFRSRVPRRPHQPLRPRHPADGRLRLQAEDDATAWVRLADQLRGHGAVLRQGRARSSA